MGAPKGSRNRAKGKEWYDAIRKEAVPRDGLRQIAKVLVDAAKNGEQWAIIELGNRLDGKPAQSVTVGGDEDHPLMIQEVHRRIVRP